MPEPLIPINLNQLMSDIQQNLEQQQTQPLSTQQKVSKSLNESIDSLHEALKLIPKGNSLRSEVLLALHHSAYALKMLEENQISLD